MSVDFWRRYGAYLEAPPQQTLEWHDDETSARGWLVINSLRGGAAGGGTRLRRGVTREEVTYLAKAMQLKFAYSGPPIGGAKSGIDFDPADPRRRDVLRRWFAAIRPILVSCYGTGGDVNVDQREDVVALCTELGIVHPQEGVVRGHLGRGGADVGRSFQALRDGLDQEAGPTYGVEGTSLTVSDLITGWGVACAADRVYRARGKTLEGVRCVVEGFGNVGGAAALYLARRGARIVGICEAENGLVSPDGLDEDDIADLLRRRERGAIPPHPQRVSGHERELAYRSEAELFIPAAISASIDARRLAQLARHGVRRIVCGANHPIYEMTLGDTENTRAADAEFEVIPEVVASQGAAHAFHCLMSHPDRCSAEDIFGSVTESVETGVDAVLERAQDADSGLMAAALDLAMERTGG